MFGCPKRLFPFPSAAAALPKIRAGVMVAPVIPALTDHELPAILQASANAGAVQAGYVPLRLPYGLKELFADWLKRHFPDRKNKVLSRIQEIRGGKMNQTAWGLRMRGEGIFSDQMAALFKMGCKEAGLDKKSLELNTTAFRRPLAMHEQLGLF
ncbi:MAG TPA: hypothetical protein VIL86_04740 [Tepidisphaeraceae bacterium]|jgi:DNA repair photolyase